MGARKMEGCDHQSWGCIVHSTMRSRKGMAEPGQASRPSLHPVLERSTGHTKHSFKELSSQSFVFNRS